jgi:general secretion pathway protein G
VLQRIRTLRQKDSESGFTLTELLIVIIVLGVLAGIVVFALGRFSDDSKIAACKTDKKSVEGAVAAYRAKNSSWPTAMSQLVGADSYLKEAPGNNGYTITLGENGVVTGSVC